MKSLITYTVPEAAKTLHISERSVYENIYQGKLRAAKICNKWIIKEEWLSEFVNSAEKKAVNE